jgi:hypothetical protein
MLVLAFGIAILGRHTRLTYLETGTPFLAAIGAAVVTTIHPGEGQCRFMAPKKS